MNSESASHQPPIKPPIQDPVVLIRLSLLGYSTSDFNEESLLERSLVGKVSYPISLVVIF